MAKIQDRKSTFYSQKQSIRDESGAPQYLESAGDDLIKELAKKQTKTVTTLQEQLEIVQNFQKGFELGPETLKGITKLEDFKVQKNEGDSCGSSSQTKLNETNDANALMEKTGLTRHELELILCEKPESTISQLYKFAMANKKHDKIETLENKLPEHPINHLKEIEEECFGHLKRKKCELKTVIFTNEEKTEVKKKKKGGNKKRRKRRKKRSDEGKLTDSRTFDKVEPSTSLQSENKSNSEKSSDEEVPVCRPSLWDVKDMKKWTEVKQQTCKPQTFYTIKDGKIVKLEKFLDNVT